MTCVLVFKYGVIQLKDTGRNLVSLINAFCLTRGIALIDELKKCIKVVLNSILENDYNLGNN